MPRRPFHPANRPFHPRIMSGPPLMTLPQNLQTDTGMLFEDFETIGDWTASQGSVADNTTQFVTGAHSVTQTSAVGSSSEAKKTISKDLSAADWRMSVQVWPVNALGDFNYGPAIRFYNDAGMSNGYRARMVAPGYLRQGVWNLFNCHKSDFVKMGSGDWASPFVRLTLGASPNSGKTIVQYWDTLRLGIKSLPAVVLNFDDGYASVYTTVYPLLKSLGLRGTVYVDTSKPGTAGYLTVAQLQEMDASGVLIAANHTNAVTALNGQAEAAQEAQILGGKTALAGWGLNKGLNYVAYPGGTWDANTKTAMTNLGMLTGRGTVALSVRTGYLPAFDMFELESQSVTNTTALATAEGWVDTAQANKSILHLHFHDVGGASDMSAADFTTLINYIYASLKAQTLYNLNVDDVYRATLGPILVPTVIS